MPGLQPLRFLEFADLLLPHPTDRVTVAERVAPGPIFPTRRAPAPTFLKRGWIAGPDRPSRRWRTGASSHRTAPQGKPVPRHREWAWGAGLSADDGCRNWISRTPIASEFFEQAWLESGAMVQDTRRPPSLGSRQEIRRSGRIRPSRGAHSKRTTHHPPCTGRSPHPGPRFDRVARHPGAPYPPRWCKIGKRAMNPVLERGAAV
jgi:hypothetical protein